MEKCAATVRALPSRSRNTPSLSAEECKAHRDSKNHERQRVVEKNIVYRRSHNDENNNRHTIVGEMDCRLSRRNDLAVYAERWLNTIVATVPWASVRL